MPFIRITTNSLVSNEQSKELKSKLAETVATIGKPEYYLMVCVDDNKTGSKTRMWFGGTNDPCAMVEVNVYGHINSSSYDSLTKSIATNVSKVLDIPLERIYTNYKEFDHWGMGEENF